jgi:hypothetical protein
MNNPVHRENKKEENRFNKCEGKSVLLHILTVSLRAEVKESY